MSEVLLNTSTCGYVWHQVGTNYLTGVCIPGGDLLIVCHNASCNCLTFKHLF